MRMRIMAAAALFALGLACDDGSAAQSAQPKPATRPKPATPVSAADLDSLLAPVALYPDQLLAQMFLCAADPVKTVHQAVREKAPGVVEI